MSHTKSLRRSWFAKKKTALLHIHSLHYTYLTKMNKYCPVSGHNDMADWIHGEADSGSAKLKRLVFVTFSVFYDGPVSLYCFVGPTLLFLKLIVQV